MSSRYWQQKKIVLPPGSLAIIDTVRCQLEAEGATFSKADSIALGQLVEALAVDYILSREGMTVPPVKIPTFEQRLKQATQPDGIRPSNNDSKKPVI